MSKQSIINDIIRAGEWFTVKDAATKADCSHPAVHNVIRSFPGTIEKRSTGRYRELAYRLSPASVVQVANDRRSSELHAARIALESAVKAIDRALAALATKVRS